MLDKNEVLKAKSCVGKQVLASIFELFDQFRATETECKQTTPELYTIVSRTGNELWEKYEPHAVWWCREREGRDGRVVPNFC